MSCDSKDREFSIVIDINENYESYKESAKSNKDEFKNKFVLFYTTWNDAGFYTLLVVRNFYEDPEGKKLGTIRICHDDLVIDNNNEEAREIRYFLEKDYKSKGKIDITDKLGKEYISIADSYLYDKLKEILIDDEAVIEFLSRLNEISTITDNERIKKIKSKEWYEKSFIREIESPKIVDFTIYKNDIDIKDNSYYVLKKLPEYFDKIKNNIAKLYDWALKYYLSIEEAKQVLDFIRNNLNEKEAERDQILIKFKNNYSQYTDFIENIYAILKKYKKILDNNNIIKNILRVKKGDLEKIAVGHYTSLETIKILIKKNKDEAAYLRLTNGRQMNDPLEGKLLIDYILDKNKNLGKNNNSKNWKPTFWYLSSATTELDSLPMWKQYGEDAKGGMLVYNRKYLEDIMEQGVEIYKVAYIDIKKDESGRDKIKVLNTNNIDVTNLQDAIDALRETIENLKEDVNEKDYMPLLSNTAILFKKSDYAYENEYRIVVNRAYNEDKIEEQDNPNYIFPFLYTYLKDKELKYSKLILGPKAIDIDYIAPYINYCDKDIEIEKSSISYR